MANVKIRCLPMKIAVIVGTRPEIIKMSPVIRALEKRDIDYYILHTGQHYSYNMDRLFFEELELPEPKYKLDVGERYSTQGAQTGEMIKAIEKIFMDDRPEVVLVEGDTNTVLAGAISASKLHIKVGHVEAGLRSWDRNMPEELNRIMTDHISDYLFAPTESSRDNLLREGIDKEKIFVTGNTIVDAVYQNLEIAKRKSKIFDELTVKKGEYALITAHRQENVDNPERLAKIVEILNSLRYPAVFPMHPRTRKRMEEFNLELDNPKLKVTEPIGYLDFLMLLSEARLVLTDSGGIQEETNILHVPCLTLRDNTERPETVDAGSNIVVGIEPKNVLEKLEKILDDKEFERNMKSTPVVFGDGKASFQIIKIINKKIL